MTKTPSQIKKKMSIFFFKNICEKVITIQLHDWFNNLLQNEIILGIIIYIIFYDALGF